VSANGSPTRAVAVAWVMTVTGSSTSGVGGTKNRSSTSAGEERYGCTRSSPSKVVTRT